MPWIARRLSSLSGWLLAGALLSAPASAAEPYRLQAGDTIDFALLGNSLFQRRIMIGQDGRISIPMGGSFQAAGLTVEALRETVVATLKTVTYPAGVDGSGAAVWAVIYPESVLVEIGEYRPIYIAGDVLTPSSQAFRSGLTVAQAVAEAGGVSAFRSRSDHSINRAQLEEEEIGARAEAYRLGLQIVRIEAELGGGDHPDFSGVPAQGVEAALAASLRSLEAKQFETRRDDLRKSRENLQSNAVNAQNRYDYLLQSQRNLEAETRIYEDELKRVEGLHRKGLMPIDRLNTAQRALFLVSTRSLDTSAEVSRVERELADIARAASKLEDTAKLENLAALKTASIDAVEAAAKLDSLQRKARVVSGSRGQAEAVRYVIARREGDALVRSEADVDTTLQPGDLLEVTLSDAGERTAEAR